MFGRTRQSEAALLEAAWSGQEVIVREILSRKPLLVTISATKSARRQLSDIEEGDTVLHLAARGGHFRIVEHLLSLNAFVNVASSNGMTPLHGAANVGHHKIVEMLLQHGARADVQDLGGRTPMHAAAAGGHPEVQQLLVNRGAAVGTKDHDGNTPLHEAARAGSGPLVRLLVENGVNVNEPNNQQRTPLHLAIISADHSAVSQVNLDLHARRRATGQMVSLLLSLGADVNAVDSLGETPLDVLSYLEGDVESNPLVDLLRAKGGQWVRYRHRHASVPKLPEAADETISGVRATGGGRSVLAGQGQSDGATGREAPIPLGNRPLLIGRLPEADVCYKSLTLSRRHARIEPKGDSYVIADMGSHNGTFIDGERISHPHILKPSDLITLGAYEFEFDGGQLIPAHGELSQEELRRERDPSTSQARVS